MIGSSEVDTTINNVLKALREPPKPPPHRRVTSKTDLTEPAKGGRVVLDPDPERSQQMDLENHHLKFIVCSEGNAAVQVLGLDEGAVVVPVVVFARGFEVIIVLSDGIVVVRVGVFAQGTAMLLAELVAVDRRYKKELMAKSRWMANMQVVEEHMQALVRASKMRTEQLKQRHTVTSLPAAPSPRI
eukprot:gene5462-6621_t